MNSTRDWEIIANYESFELVKRDYFTRHGREPNTQHAREIAAPFSHARSYFRSAHGAELTVKPLLLYYGVVSLSRGLTLLLSRGLREVALTPNHGLSATGWLAIVSKTKPNFAELRVKVTGGGTLMDLSKATEHRSLLRSGSSAVNWKEVCPPLSSGMEFGFGELLSRIPLLQDHYVRWTNETNCAPLECVTGNPGEAITLKLLRYGKNYLNQNVAAKIFDRTPYQFMSEDTDAIYYSGPSNTDDGPGLTDSIKVTSVHSDYFKDVYFAERPPCERLVNRKLDLRNINIMQDWKEALKQYIDQYYTGYLN